MRESIGRILTLTKRNIKEILRDPLSLVLTMALPLVMEILFYLIFHELTAQFEMKYLAPGIVVFAQAFLITQGFMVTHLTEVIVWIAGMIVLYRKPKEYLIAVILSVAVAFVYETFIPYWG